MLNVLQIVFPLLLWFFSATVALGQVGPSGTLITPKGEHIGKLHHDDGDSFGIGLAFVRIAYVDAPEQYQLCQPAIGDRVPCGIAARDMLEDLIVQGVTCRADNTEKWKRWLSVCLTSDGLDVGLELVRRGWACVVHGAPANYYEAQKLAMNIRSGIWDTDYSPSTLCVPPKRK